MSGDLSLSRTLGGLRIANPDDTSASDGRDAAVDSNADGVGLDGPGSGSGSVDGRWGRSANPTTAGDGQVSSYVSSSPLPSQGPAAHAVTQTPESSMSSSPHDSRLPQTATQVDAASRPYQSSSSSRPVSGIYALQGQNDMRGESSRASMYAGHAAGGDAMASGPYASNVPSRESSYREGSHNTPRQLPPAVGAVSVGAPLPPRRSSRGMGGGYASIPGIPMVPHSAVQGLELPVSHSSEEWKDRGAAVGIRKEIDANGKTVIRQVKKGVRDFSFGRVLGEGSYSIVYLATDRQTLKEYAVKVLEKKHIIKEKKIKYVNIEKNTLNRLTEHPGIVRLYYTFQDESSLYYVLDLCSGGELLGVLKKTGTFDEECTRFYGAQILDAIQYMHSRGVIHRDLKPENVLLDDQMHIKITDFGTAKLLDDPRAPQPPLSNDRSPIEGGKSGQGDNNRAASFVGTAEYVSPELLTHKTACKASDIWAFGCIIYQLLAGRPPFKAATEYLTFQKIVNLEYEFPPGFPPAARDLVERCLVLDPSRRLTIDHIKNHEFFDGQAFGKQLWRTKAPRLRPYVPQQQERNIIQLNGASSAPQPIATSRGQQQSAGNAINEAGRPAPRVITELPPPTQLDIEWSPVLTRNNERILKLGDLMVISTPIPNSPHGKGADEGHKKLSRFFGGSTTKKRQRLVMVTSSGRIVLAPAGGEEKRAKQELSLLAPDCTWRSHIDAKGTVCWCVDTVSQRLRRNIYYWQ